MAISWNFDYQTHRDPEPTGRIAAATDEFSRLCTKLVRLQRSVEAAADDIAVFGAPSECFGLVCEAIDNETCRLLDEAGYSPSRFCAELEKRVSGRWIYESGLAHILPPTDW